MLGSEIPVGHEIGLLIVAAVFIAFALVSWWGRTLFVPATVRTREIAPAAVIPRLERLVLEPLDELVLVDATAQARHLDAFAFLD